MAIGTTQFSNFPYYERLDLLLMASCESGAMNSAKRSELVRCELTEPLKAHAFGINSRNARAAIERRADFFEQLLNNDRLSQLPLHDVNEVVCLRTLWRLWLPLAIDLIDARIAANRPVVQGVLGGQGMGKTTLARALTLLLGEMNHPTVAISIDDLYKTHADRQQLKHDDPRFIRRGPPGTHDIDLGVAVLDRLRHRQLPVAVPRFDKSLHGGDGDRVEPTTVESAEIVIFEGWFVGAQPAEAACFDTAPDPIASDDDRQFARDCNAKLSDYQPLWARTDRLAILNPVDYHLSRQWRMQAEREAIAAGKAGMSDGEIEEFVEYFWKALHPDLFVKPLLDRAQLVVRIEADHSIGEIHGKPYPASD